MKKLLIATAITAALTGCEIADDDASHKSTNTSHTPSSVSIEGVASVDGGELIAVIADADGSDGATKYNDDIGDIPEDEAADVDSGLAYYTWTNADGDLLAEGYEPTFPLDISLAGEQVFVTVEFIDDRGNSEIAKSPSKAIAPDNAGEVSITGLTAMPGNELTATLEDLDGTSDTDSFVYEWTNEAGTVLQSTNGTSVNDIYTITAADTLLGLPVKVAVTYTDDLGFETTVESDYTLPLGAVDVPGIVTVARTTGTGDFAIGTVLTASATDEDGASNFTYQWSKDILTITLDEDGVTPIYETTRTIIDGAIGETYTYVDGDEGQLISVEVFYDDAVFGPVSAVAEAAKVVPSLTIAPGTAPADVVTAIANAPAGSGIVLPAETFADIGTLTLDKPMTLMFSQGSGVVAATATSDGKFTGEVCLHVTSDNVVLDGLYFEDMLLDSTAGNLCSFKSDGGSETNKTYLKIDGDNVVLKNSTFMNEADTTSKTAWVTVNGANAHITRNTFSGRQNDIEGMFLKTASTSNADEGEEIIPRKTVVEYNYFSDFVAANSTGAAAIFFGNDSGSSSAKPFNSGQNILRHNLFENIGVKQRLVKVQTSHSEIYGNTFVNTLGMIHNENGGGNKFAYNVFIGNAGATFVDEGDVAKYNAGIAVNPYGHEIFNNYFAGLANNDTSERGAIATILDEDLAHSSVDVSEFGTVVSVESNTMINASSPFTLDDSDCSNIDDFVSAVTLTLDSNLAVNNYSPEAATEFTGEAKTVEKGTIWDECAAIGLVLSNERYYSKDDHNTNSKQTERTALPEGTNVITGDADEASIAEYTETNSNEEVVGLGFYVATGEDAGIGADVTKLHRITSTEVGVNSSWMSTASYEGLELPLVEEEDEEESEE